MIFTAVTWCPKCQARVTEEECPHWDYEDMDDDSD